MKNDGFLNNQEVEAIVLAAVAGSGERGCSTEEASRVVDWADQVRMDAALVRLIVEGKLKVDAQSNDPGEWKFAPTDAPQPAHNGENHGE